MPTIFQLPSDNVASAATLTYTGAMDANYPVANVVDGNPAKPAKWTATAGSIVFDFTSARALQLCAILNHNLTSAATVRIQGNATNVWTSPSFTATFTIPTAREDGFSMNPFLDFATTNPSYRYFRIDITGNPVNIAIGEVWLGATRRYLTAPIQKQAVHYEEHPIIEHVTPSLVSMIYDLKAVRRALQAQLIAKGAAASELRTWSRSASARVKPTLWIRDTSVNDAWLVRFSNAEWRERRESVDTYAADLNLQEVSPGMPL